MRVSKENDVIRLQHMLEAAAKAQMMGEGQTRESLETDEMRLLAIAQLLTIIGEAASKVTIERQQQFTQIPWSQIISMRNRLIHGYFEIDLDIVVDTLDSNLPTLITMLNDAIGELNQR
ncbi:MAG: DUF86 domain-containing protein [Anaerolineae bacterium]|nr:DUF86 domain-containing protein [Anaerolineae bacterium]